MIGIFWWVVFPYIAATIMIFGLFYRFVYRQKTWAAPSTEFFEKKWLRIGSPLFHYGIIFAFIGHVMGMILPKRIYDMMGVSEETYHFFAILGGGFVGMMVVAGLVILLIRKTRHQRLRVHATFADYFGLLMVLIVSALGTYITVIYNTTVHAFEYRTTIGPWFRSLFYFQPQYHLMESIPFIFQLMLWLLFCYLLRFPLPCSFTSFHYQSGIQPAHRSNIALELAIRRKRSELNNNERGHEDHEREEKNTMAAIGRHQLELCAG